jgi:hypothetical protein
MLACERSLVCVVTMIKLVLMVMGTVPGAGEANVYVLTQVDGADERWHGESVGNGWPAWREFIKSSLHTLQNT